MSGEAAFKQLEVINALTIRETRTRFGQYRLGYVWALAEPMLFIMTFVVIFNLTHRRSPSGMDTFTFLTTGFIPYLTFTGTWDACSAAISGNKPLLFFPQVRIPDIIAARTYLEVSTKLAVFGLLLALRALFTGKLELDNVLYVVGGFLLAGLLGAGTGLIFCCIGVLFKTADRVKGILMRPLFWTSGLFYTVDTLPLRIRELLAYNPVLHVVEMVRDGWHSTYTSPVIDVPYVLLWVVVTLFIGLTLERRIRHLVHAE